MTASEGYVWFLPAWLSKDWTITNDSSSDSCTKDQLNTVSEKLLSLTIYTSAITYVLFISYI